MTNETIVWPEVDLSSWTPTKRSLHLYAQMLGKLRLALAPDQPNWMHTALLLSARGLTTGPMPWKLGALQASLDVFDSRIVLQTSDARERAIALHPARTVAEVYASLVAALRELEIDATVTPVPQEIPDTTPFDRDRTAPAYDVFAVQRWFAATTAIADVFDRWRARFFGRTGIQLWWGAFDLALLLFSGKKVTAPLDRGYLFRYDLDAEMLNAGIYYGDPANPAPFFYGYAYPQPADAETAPMPPGVSWSDALKEWVLPYETVRTSADPVHTLATFLDALYERTGWEKSAHVYDHPSARNRVRWTL